MAHQKPRIVVGPNRLCAAADLLLEAIHSQRGFNSRVRMYIRPLRKGERASGSAFSCEEFIEAMAMLIRMGLVPGRRPMLGVR